MVGASFRLPCPAYKPYLFPRHVREGRTTMVGPRFVFPVLVESSALAGQILETVLRVKPAGKASRSALHVSQVGVRVCV